MLSQVEVRTCVYQGLRNVRYFGSLGVLSFLVTSVLKLAFLPYYRRFIL